LFAAALCWGRYPISLKQLITVLSWRSNDSLAANIIYTLRFPRALGAILIGGSLALSGAAYQSVFQNPLVSPGLLGVANGAAVGAALAILLKANFVEIQAAAFFCGLIAVLFSIAIPHFAQQRTTLALVLAGIVVSGLMQAILGLLKYLADPESQLQDIVYWQLGSLAKVTLGNLAVVIPIMLISAGTLLLLRWHLTVISLGTAAAQLQGINVIWERNIIIVCATALTASAVCLSGPISWVGLVIPHIARLMVGSNMRHALPLAGILGAIFLLTADTLARSLTAGEIPLSILTGFIGTPIFIYFLLAKKVHI
jgi:iron complex transport system permease protein